MNRANYTSEQRDIIAMCHRKRDELLDFISSPKWEVTSNNKKENYTVS